MVEVMNVPPDVEAQMYKLASINLSPNVTGQVAMGVMVKPPGNGVMSIPYESHVLILSRPQFPVTNRTACGRKK